jgi:hypothetical protein
MRRLLIVIAVLGGLVLAGSAEARGWRPDRHWHGRSSFHLGLDFLVPLYPYPTYRAPALVPAPVYQPQCFVQTTPGYWARVPWYTEPGGYTVFRDEWIPPRSAQVCR